MHRLYVLLLLFTHTALAQSLLTRRLDSFFHTQPATAPGIALSIEKHGEVITATPPVLPTSPQKLPWTPSAIFAWPR